MIDPGTQPDGEEYTAYNRRRWGGDGWTRPMKASGRKEGAAYANWKWWPNTTHASRLLMFAENFGLGDRVLGILYRMCYEEGENVSLRATVGRAAVEANVPGGEAFVHSDAGMAELQQQLTEAKVNGKRVRAAPTFNVRVGQAAHDFSGAQDSSYWAQLLTHCAQQALDEEQAS
mmetsp:Transcript_22469/g.50777  ORF Transcript_22469/g.50777 Transcript_22469/m.50777 type:complete len:174 (-) Transcript_22469:433-954(-)